MALESVTHLDDLEVANPLGTDPRSEGDNHIRNVKKALKTDFPNINGVVAATPADLNLTTGITAGTVLASKFVLVDSSKKVNEWLVDNVTIDGNSITSTSGDLQLKAVSGSNLTLQDDADAAKEVTLVMSSVTSGQDRAWTFPDSDGTFIGAATTDTLTNKTIDAGEFTTDLNLNDSVPIRLGTAEDSSIAFDGTDLIILTDGAGASGIILDSEDNTVEIKGSGTLQATFDAGGLDLASGDAYEINDVSVLNATTLGGAVVSSSLTSTGALNSGSITSGFGAIDNGASAITSTGTITGGVVVADNLQLDANALTSTDSNGDITITPNGTGDIVLDGQKFPQADGSANQILVTNGSAQLSWGTPATTTALTTHGDVLFRGASALERLGAGTSGQFLTSGGASANVSWTTGAAVPTAITVADESSDTTCFPLFVTAATGDLGPKSAAGLTFNSSTDTLHASQLSTAGGLAFPASQSASSDANTLDDYEEGYFTMAMTSAGGSLTINSSYDQGSYTKIGRLVVARGYCIASSVSSPTGDFNITGLPFAQAALTEDADNGTGSVRISGCESDITAYVYAQVGSGSTNVLIREGGLTGGGNDVAAHINTGTSVAFCVSYFTT